MERAEVLSVREFRAGLAEAIRAAREEGPVFVGSHRRAEAVLMSIEQYDELRGVPRRPQVPRWLAVEEAVASVRAEGLEPSEEGMRVLEAFAADDISEEEAIAALVRRHRR
ncbi:type II toxin-antitoxin system prevent-host-death family antitoxin [Actinomycetospora termitidis]|uniref:Antitoxin n=1 Tax=Actinomycetospora termitidis TaxID=3053470 RepID=A0ABT7M5K9_9PSEU|nr:type II toxin-antitoxin system prevent-host-death family antitoxin [Actinomycetospora sp. Odt1-22]MDL5155965.1 type II toxin-antitoxin system prevent-host-death family antitoxin [Actinomycetospora sp. Odt1-22]